jgi:NADPH2:quinone reductase
MRAIVLTSFDGLDGLELAEVTEPRPGDGEELVHVRAVALGPWDRQATEGYFTQLGGSSDFPQVQGWDFAGETHDGRRVLGFVAQPRSGRGALAERIAVPSALLSALPDGLDWKAASALPVSAITAHLLVETARVSSGDVMLVTGAAGMVGGLAVQLASARGARVIGAVRDRDAPEARALGAEATVDTADLEQQIRERWPDGVSACLDTLGIRSALTCVRDNGAFATTQPTAVPEPSRGIEPRAVQAQPDAVTLARLAEQAVAGQLTVRVAQTLLFDRFHDAYKLLERGGLRGKIVLTPTERSRT